MQSPAQDIVEFPYRGKTVRFQISDPTDIIQLTQASQTFYEADVLERLRLFIPGDAIVADIGANVGNHTVFFGLYCKPERIFVFEPNTHLQSILSANIELNGLRTVDQSFVRYGLSDSPAEAKLRVMSTSNWGSGHLVPAGAPDGEFSEIVPLRTLDSFNIEKIHFIKADVEGHELRLLKGAEETIKRCGPVIFIEVGRSRIGEVNKFLEALDYRLVEFNSMYRGQGNYLFVPVF